MGIHTGLRIKSEALALQKSDVDLVRGFLIVRPPMRRTGARAFVFAKRNGTRSRSITKPFRTACEAAGLADVSPYALRHAFASKLAMAGVDPATIQAGPRS